MKVLVTEPIIDSELQRLDEQTQLTVGQRGEFNCEDALIEAASHYDALLTMLSNPVTRKVLRAGKNQLKIVANYAVGTNNIDLEAARDFAIPVSNTPEVLTESTAEIALSLILSVARKTTEAESRLRDGEFRGWEPTGFLGLELHGARLGIVGLGRIGQALAKRARACGMEILYHNRRRIEMETEKQLNAHYVENLDQLLPAVDVLSLHCPLTEKTHHLIDAERLKLLPDHALIINTSRGPVIDEKALVDALRQGSIGGAGLDVFENEPKVEPGLLETPNTVLLPHIGSATYKSRRAMGRLAVNAILSVQKNQTPGNLVT